MAQYKSKNWPAKLRSAMRGTTIAAIEREAGWRKGYLNNALGDVYDISVSRAVVLADIVNVDVGWLFNDSDTRSLEEVQATRAITDAHSGPANLSKFAEIIQRAAREIAELETGTNTPEDLDLRQAREAVEAGLAAERQENFAKRPGTDRTSGKAG